MRKPRKAPVQAKGGAGGAPVKRGTGRSVTGRGAAPKRATGRSITGRGRAGAGGGAVPRHAAKKPKPARKRQWSPGTDVACCSAQAVGTLLGWDWQDVLALYWRTADDPDAGASILATLEASEAHIVGRAALIAGRDSNPRLFAGLPLILGVSLPEPHAVAVTPGGTWWSWGEPFNPGEWPDLEVEEVWAVRPGG